MGHFHNLFSSFIAQYARVSILYLLDFYALNSNRVRFVELVVVRGGVADLVDVGLNRVLKVEPEVNVEK
jgi:hypothetical protein